MHVSCNHLSGQFLCPVAYSLFDDWFYCLCCNFGILFDWLANWKCNFERVNLRIARNVSVK